MRSQSAYLATGRSSVAPSPSRAEQHRCLKRHAAIGRPSCTEGMPKHSEGGHLTGALALAGLAFYLRSRANFRADDARARSDAGREQRGRV
jgi:hypothetical protein